MQSDWPLIFYIVYDHAKDYPYKYVVRRWFQEGERYWPDDDLFFASEDIELIRRKLSDLGLVCLIFPELDPGILETWL